MRKALVSLCFIALAIALPAGAQTPMQKVDRMTVVTARPGMAPQWEAGLEKLNVWVRQHNLPLTHYVWTIVSGPRDGQYVIGVVGHNWKDFDAAAKASHGLMAQIVADLDPYTESHLASYWTYREDLNGRPENTRQTPPAFFSVTTYFVKVGGIAEVQGAIKQIRAAIKKSHWPGNPGSWYALVNGGYAPQLALVTGHKNWADFQPAEPTFFKMLRGVYGNKGAAAIFKEFDSAVRARRTEIWLYRPDLSYIAASH